MATRRTARRNPIGMPAPRGSAVVQIGEHGKHTHLFDPTTGGVICNSGKNAGRVGKHGDRRGKPQEVFASNAKFITCYRCQKLAQINIAAGRPAWKGP